MEGEKRKQANREDVVSGRQKQKMARNDNVGGVETAVTEDEVEEFFAILKRIQVAVRHFKNADGGGRKFPDGGSRLRAMLESNGDCNRDKVGPKRVEGVKENMGLDLNAVPDPEM